MLDGLCPILRRYPLVRLLITVLMRRLTLMCFLSAIWDIIDHASF